MIRFISIDHNFIKIYNDKNIRLFYQNLVDIVLETSRSIEQAKQRDLIFKIALSGTEHCFSFIFILNLHLMINVDQVKLYKALGPT